MEDKKEYIDREAVLTVLKAVFDETSPVGEEQFGILKAHRIVREAPAADVVEVVHGEWIHNPKREYDYICSVCRGDAPEDRMRNNAILTPYCPHCGAKMDGGKK